MLLEREGLLESLGERLQDATDGKGSLVLIAGEAGAGKTSLVRTFVESLEDSTLVIQGACDPLTTPRPLSPLYDFAADPDSGLADLATGERDAIELFGEVLDRLRNTIRPIIMVIEDIHWADEGTLDFLRFIGRRVGDSKATVVCTYRDDEVSADHPIRTVLGQLIPLDSTLRLVIPPLTIRAITTLAADRPIDSQELLDLTGGNAFYVTEVLASDEGLPHTVQEAVLARVARLDDLPRRVVEGVSVAPRALEVADVSTLVGATPDDIDAALSAGVLLGEGKNLRFRHELARAAVEESLPPARRLALHTRMLGLLEEMNSPDLSRMAHHAMRAGDPTKTIEYAPQAARQAARTGAHKEAIAFFEAALQHVGAVDVAGKAALHLELADELGTVDHRVEALENIDRAIEIYREIGDEQSLADTLIPHTGARWRFENSTKFRRDLREALEILEPEGPSATLARAHLTSAYQYMLARRGSNASRDIAKAKTAAASASANQLMWTIKMLEGTIALVVGDASEGMRILGEQAREAAAKGRTDDETLALMMLGSGGGEVRRYPDAIPALENGVDHGLEVDQDYLVSYCRAWLARIALEQGQWDDAVAYAEQVDRATPNRTGIGILTALSALGRVRVRRGDPGGLVLLEEMCDLAQRHELQHGWNAICGRAEYHWLAGSPERGLDHLVLAYQRAVDTDSEWARGEIGFWMWRAGVIHQPAGRAAEPFALQMRGEWQAAADTWEEIGCPYEVAMALADGPESAKLEALGIFDSLGARPMSDRVRKELRNLGVESIPRGPTKETLANPAGLTPRQLEVLELIGHGLSNHQIADRLYLSKKTVEHHVSAIYSKLGVNSRSQAIHTATRIAAIDK